MKKEVKIGILMITALAVLLWGVNFLKGRNVFTSNNNYVVIYNEVNGLLESNGVFIKGYQVGHVGHISFKDEKMNQLKVVLSIKKTIKIPRNTIARIVTLDLMGTKAVELIFTNDYQNCYNEGDTLIAEVELSVTKQLEPYKDQAAQLMKTMDSLSNQILKIFNDATILHMRGTLKNLNITTGAIAESSDDLKNTLYNVEVLTRNLKDHNRKVAEILSNTSEITDSLKQLRLNTLINNLNQTIDDSRLLVNSIRNGNGTMSKLIQSDTMYVNLSKTVDHLDSLIMDIKKNPKRYISISVFGSK